MTTIAKLVEEIKNDKIKNEDLIICLEDGNLRVVSMAIFKIIERNYCNERIVNRLVQLGTLLKDNKFVGPWQFGHIAIATLSLLNNDEARRAYSQIINKLDETDKFLIDNFIKSRVYK